MAAARSALVFETASGHHWARRSAVSDGLHRTNRIVFCGLQKEAEMPRIAIPKREDAPAESKPILDNVDKMLGFVPNLHRLMSISPNALFGWATLMGSLAKTLDVKTRDGIALAVSEAD